MKAISNRNDIHGRTFPVKVPKESANSMSHLFYQRRVFFENVGQSSVVGSGC
jgi:hypothetical protein